MVLSFPLLNVLTNQGWMRVLESLRLVDKPCSLRELAALTDMSPAGMSDILARLESAQVVSKERIKNRHCYSLRLSAAELELLDHIIAMRIRRDLHLSAEELSSQCEKLLGWIDETVHSIRYAKEHLDDAN